MGPIAIQLEEHGDAHITFARISRDGCQLEAVQDTSQARKLALVSVSTIKGSLAPFGAHLTNTT